MRGGEKVLEAILNLFPDADVFTHVYVPESVSPDIYKHNVRTSFIQNLPFASKAYKKYLPLMPLALEQLDLREYDLVISSESGPAKGVLTGANTLHVCYCHTPMRYLWDFYQNYLEESGMITRMTFRIFAPLLRIWDTLTAQRVDFFVANSHNVARRIAKHYHRFAEVIYPPVDVQSFAPSRKTYPVPKDYYLCVGQLVAYKRVDLAVQACNCLRKQLVVIGDGPEQKKLKTMAGSTVTFLGRQDDTSLRRYMQCCRALLFPGEEDFGIVPVEALAAGRPVIAFGRGGVLETVRHGHTGILFPTQDTLSLCSAIKTLESGLHNFEPTTLTKEVERFSCKRFQSHFSRFLEDCLHKNTDR
jgi:glycosyltransferase involved in cell wall biosynthesis